MYIYIHIYIYIYIDIRPQEPYPSMAHCIHLGNELDESWQTYA